MKKTLLGMTFGVIAGLLAGSAHIAIANTSSEPSVDGLYFHGSPCADRLDTMCHKWSDDWPPYPHLGAEQTRFVDEGQFCTLTRTEAGGPETLRCEVYWPFTNPRVNADAAPAEAFTRRRP